MAIGRYLNALLWKNWLLWKRKIGGSLCEILFPIILVGLIAVIRILVENTDHPTEMHIQSSNLFSIDDPMCGEDFCKMLKSYYPNVTPNKFDLQTFANKYAIVGKNHDLNMNLSRFLNDTIIANLEYEYKAEIGFNEYQTEQQLFDYIRGNDYQKNNNKADSLIFAIKVPENAEEDKNYDFTIYMSTNFPTQMPDTKFYATTVKPSKDNFEGYAKNGFATLQYYLSQFVLKMEHGTNAPIVDIVMAEGKTKAYTQNEFMDSIGESLPLFILLIFIAPQYRFIQILP